MTDVKSGPAWANLPSTVPNAGRFLTAAEYNELIATHGGLLHQVDRLGILLKRHREPLTRPEPEHCLMHEPSCVRDADGRWVRPSLPLGTARHALEQLVNEIAAFATQTRMLTTPLDRERTAHYCQDWATRIRAVQDALEEFPYHA
jgi:hypothetical protein